MAVLERNRTLAHTATWALWGMAANPEVKDEIEGSGGVAAILAISRAFEEPDIRELCVTAIQAIKRRVYQLPTYI